MSTIQRQKRLSVPPGWPMLRPAIGTGSALTRSPRTLRSAGINVSAAATETTPTMIAPTARLRMMFVGTSSIPKRAATNVAPLNSTARLAVAPARLIAFSFTWPAVRSSR